MTNTQDSMSLEIPNTASLHITEYQTQTELNSDTDNAMSDEEIGNVKRNRACMNEYTEEGDSDERTAPSKAVRYKNSPPSVAACPGTNRSDTLVKAISSGTKPKTTPKPLNREPVHTLSQTSPRKDSETEFDGFSNDETQSAINLSQHRRSIFSQAMENIEAYDCQNRGINCRSQECNT